VQARAKRSQADNFYHQPLPSNHRIIDLNLLPLSLGTQDLVAFDWRVELGKVNPKSPNAHNQKGKN